MPTPRQRQLEWVKNILDETGMTVNALAEKANVTAPNLYRFLDENSDKTLRKATIMRIAAAMARKPPFDASDMNESDARPFEYKPADFAPPDPKKNPRLIAYAITSTVLIRAGFEPGDIAIIDTDATPAPGCLVMAQIVDHRLGDAETVLRWYEPPYLISPSDDPDFRKPYLIDGSTVHIRGVVVRQLRNRDLSKNS